MISRKQLREENEQLRSELEDRVEQLRSELEDRVPVPVVERVVVRTTERGLRQIALNHAVDLCKEGYGDTATVEIIGQAEEFFNFLNTETVSETAEGVS